MTDFETGESTSSSSELWRVRLPSGDMRAMTLDELDAAFEAGQIDGDTMVLEPDAPGWQRLSVAAGLEPANAGTPAQAAAPVVAPPSMRAPDVAPASQRLSIPASAYSNSTVPVVADTMLDDIEMPQPKRKGAVWVLAACAVLAGGWGLVRATSSPDLGPAGAAAAGTPTVNAADVVKPPATPAADPAPPATADTARFSDEQKRALLQADKVHEAQAKARAAAKALTSSHSSPHSSRPTGGASFSKGGDAHDPLNSKL